MPDTARARTAALCRERAEQYGALRHSSLTAVALDRAAVMLDQNDDHFVTPHDAERARQILEHSGLDKTRSYEILDAIMNIFCVKTLSE